MARLIINADDLGYSPAVNRAIVDLHRRGLVTSASMLVNQPFSQEAADLALGLSTLSIGVHLNLSKGYPILPADQVSSLVDDEGRFWHSTQFYPKALLGQIDWFEAAAELEAQISWAAVRGLMLDNLDSHVHFHMLPPARRIIEHLAQAHGVVAWRTPRVLATLFPNKLWNELMASPPRPGWLLTPDYLLSLHQWGERLLTDEPIAHLLSQADLVVELVVHPGYRDDPWLPLPDQLPPDRRQSEVDLLTSPAFADWLQRLDLTLMSFADLKVAQSLDH